MWLTLAMFCLVLWLLAVGLFHVTGTSVHLLALLAIVSLASHLNGTAPQSSLMTGHSLEG